MHRILTLAAAAGLAIGGLAAPSSAASVLEIHVTGVDLYYNWDGKWNIHSGPNPGDLDPVDTASFYVDGNLVGVLVGNMTANVGLSNFQNIPVGGGVVKNQHLGYFSFNFDTTDHNVGYLGMWVEGPDSAELYYTGDELGIAIIGHNTGISIQQPMPVPGFPLFDEFETIIFSWSSSNFIHISDDGEYLTQWHARGTANVTGPAIPEPSSALALAGAGLLALRRRRA